MPLGMYKLRYISLDLKGALTTYNRLLHYILKLLPCTIAYLDYVTIFLRSFKEYVAPIIVKTKVIRSAASPKTKKIVCFWLLGSFQWFI